MAEVIREGSVIDWLLSPSSRTTFLAPSRIPVGPFVLIAHYLVK